MRNDNARLTPRGELVADVLTALLLIGMGYAIVRAVAIVVVRLGQFLGLV
jgi:signal transduction protein with GAF and PtsI domain